MSEARGGWFSRLKQGLSRTSSSLKQQISAIFTKKTLDDDTLDDLEDTLIMADLGVATARDMVGALRRERFGKEVSDEEVRRFLAERLARVVAPVAGRLQVGTAKPAVILMVGVNGSGKTTTIGKLAARFQAEGKSVLVAAGDTFRAAAIEQLEIWTQRLGVALVKRQLGADAAALAFDAYKQAAASGMDVLLIDTAGRLQNKATLMAELAKIVRVLQKADPDLPHETLLVLDATTGQNALNQVEIFQATVPITGLVVTKLDGTAKGGVVVALAERFGLPVVAVGVGERAEDLRAFEAEQFTAALMGLETTAAGAT